MTESDHDYCNLCHVARGWMNSGYMFVVTSAGRRSSSQLRVKDNTGRVQSQIVLSLVTTLGYPRGVVVGYLDSIPTMRAGGEFAIKLQRLLRSDGRSLFGRARIPI